MKGATDRPLKKDRYLLESGDAAKAFVHVIAAKAIVHVIVRRRLSMR